MRKKIFTALTAVLLAAMLAGCTGNKESKEPQEPQTLIETSEDGRAVYVSFDDTDKGTGGGTGVTVGEGERLVADSALEKGKVQVQVVPGGADMETIPFEEGADPVYDEEYTTETGREEIPVDAGNYMIYVTVSGKAAGKITFTIE